MRTVKTILLLLLTGAVLLACAGLPALAARIQDRSASPREADLLPIHLELTPQENQEREPANILGTLALLQNAYIFPLTEEAMTMTPAQVLDTAREQLAPYVDMGLIPETDYSFQLTEPLIAMSADSLGSYLPFWSVTLSREEDPYEHIFLHLDDSTGRILLIQYEGYSQTLAKEFHGSMLEALSTTFLDILQVSEALETLDGPEATVNLVELTEKSTALSCTIDTKEYGTILVEFFMHEHGFHSAFPTSPD